MAMPASYGIGLPNVRVAVAFGNLAVYQGRESYQLLGYKGKIVKRTVIGDVALEGEEREKALLIAQNTLKTFTRADPVPPGNRPFVRAAQSVLGATGSVEDKVESA